MEDVREKLDSIRETGAGTGKVAVGVHGKDAALANGGHIVPFGGKSCAAQFRDVRATLYPHGITTITSVTDCAISAAEARNDGSPARPSTSSPPALATISGTQWPPM